MTQGGNKKNILVVAFKKVKTFLANSNTENKKIPPWLWGVFLFLALIIFAEIGYLIFMFNEKQKPIERVVWQETQTRPIEVEEVIEEGYPRAIDGVLLENEENTNLWPAGVMIDNMINARPPAGISHANLVIESITESDITRFLVFFDLGAEIEKIGPVRSARPYFAEWASEFGAMYVHSGGSPEALDKLQAGEYDVYDLNEFYNGNDFWRDNNRYAPHNLFTSTELLETVMEKKISDKEANFTKYSFKSDLDLDSRGEGEQEIKIYFNNTDHFVRWVYDREANDYIRYQAGKKHLEIDGSEIRAKNIAVQYVSMEVLDNVGRKRIPTVDSKKALLFRDGQVVEGAWEKPNNESRTKFYTSSDFDQELEFNRGTTWIEVVPVGVEVSF